MELTGYQKRYRIRRAIPSANSLEVTFPFDVVERYARQLGISIDDFLATYSVIAEYDHQEVKYTISLTPTK